MLSPTFAFSGSEVFTINVRLLSVNTSINTAQCFTSYASFWLSHLFKESSRERKGDGERGEEEERCMWVHGCSTEAARRVQHKATLTSADEVAAIIARSWSNDSNKKKKASTMTETAVRHLGPRHNHRFFFFSRRFVTKINLNVTSREKVKSQS